MPYRSIRIGNNLHPYIWQGRGNNCNVCLFTDILRGKRRHIIIDPGHLVNELGEGCFDDLVKSMERDGIKVEDIGLIINTHAHPDHCEANQAIVQKSRGKGGNSQTLIALSREEDEYRRRMGERLYSLLGVKPPEFEPFFYLGEGNLTLGKENRLNLQILNTPGHSPGSISLYLPEGKILIAGDVIFCGSVGRTDFPGGSLATLRKSIERLSELDIECLICGHSTELGSIIMGRERLKHNFQAIRPLIY